MKFSEFNFHPSLLEGIESLRFDTATPIQELAIPEILKGRDIMGSAQTGTGKTAAFLLPVIQQIITEDQDSRVKALIIVPTRELSVQIDQHMEAISYFTPVSSIAVYGGTDGVTFAKEKNAFLTGADIVIATPGRMISHLNNDYVDFSGIKYLILDEADRMLDMGFYDDIIKIISYLPEKRQNLMFSATMPKNIKILANKILINPYEISLSVSKPVENVLQIAYILFENQKQELLKDLLKDKALSSILIFCSTKLSAKALSKVLKKSAYSIEDIHSDLDQQTRERVLAEFKNRKLNILVATDILSRGIDVEDIDLVVNYDVPNDSEDYIHRIGRTARAKSDGVAITFVNEKEQNKFFGIETFLGAPVYKMAVPEFLGDTPEYKPGRRGKNIRFKPSRK
ncbi:MAG: DEAD/DEAH box helicase [Bacteroidota bacterium]